MQSKYEWLISLADDIEDLEQIWSAFLKDLIGADVDVFERNRIVLLFCERYEKLKGR